MGNRGQLGVLATMTGITPVRAAHGQGGSTLGLQRANYLPRVITGKDRGKQRRDFQSQPQSELAE